MLTAEDLGERLQHLTLDSLLFGVFCADVAIALAELDFVDFVCIKDIVLKKVTNLIF